MTNPWAPPDRSGARGSEEAHGHSRRRRAAQLWAYLRPFVAAALAVASAVLLLGAPVGLLWAAVAPRADVVVLRPGAADFAMPTREDFVASDGVFLLLTMLVGALCGLAAWRLARRWGPAVVVALAVAAVGASAVAAEVGSRVGVEGLRAGVRAGTPAMLEANVRLLAKEALVGWPIAAVLGFLVPYYYRPDDSG